MVFYTCSSAVFAMDPTTVGPAQSSPDRSIPAENIQAMYAVSCWHVFKTLGRGSIMEERVDTVPSSS